MEVIENRPLAYTRPAKGLSPGPRGTRKLHPFLKPLPDDASGGDATQSAKCHIQAEKTKVNSAIPCDRTPKMSGLASQRRPKWMRLSMPVTMVTVSSLCSRLM